MAHIEIRGRVALVHGPGVALVSSDLHGNREDFGRLADLFEAEREAVLLFLGDLFHGPAVPPETWAADYDHLGDWYPDRSAELLGDFLALRRRYPRRVVSLLGNHEHGHVGGPVVGKFHDDESAAFEATLASAEVDALRATIRAMPLVGASDAGVAFTHGAPPGLPFDAATLDGLVLEGYTDWPLWRMHEAGLLGQLLWRRSSRPAETDRFLAHLRGVVPEMPCGLVVYGHERVDEGFEVDHPRLVNLSTSFGMRRANKTYLHLDLARRHDDAAALARSGALRPLYGS